MPKLYFAHPECKYSKGVWSECTNGAKERLDKLKTEVSTSGCKPEKAISKQCKKRELNAIFNCTMMANQNLCFYYQNALTRSLTGAAAREASRQRHWLSWRASQRRTASTVSPPRPSRRPVRARGHRNVLESRRIEIKFASGRWPTKEWKWL